MKNFIMPIGLLLGIALLFSCNPECENYAGVNAEISPSILLPGEQIMVTTTPSNFLQNRELFIEKLVNGTLKIDETTKIVSKYMDGESAKGRIATLPMDVEGNRNLYIRDDDCGGFIPLNSVNIVDKDFIAQNQQFFIAPTTPNIVIPTLPSVPPVNVINTWFSPNDRDYCIWIVPELVFDSNAGCYKETAPLKPGDVGKGIGNKDSGSWELRTGCDEASVVSDLFHLNPISGIIDRNTGIVKLSIDRTSKGMPIEHFEGSLMIAGSVTPDERIVGDPQDACSPDLTGKEADYMMVLNSLETGRQMILYQFDVVGLGFHEKRFCN